MINTLQNTQIEYGDFQTPIELAKQICQKLNELDILPTTIIEPTCGLGTFIETSAFAFPSAQKIIGIEFNISYLNHLENQKKHFFQGERISLMQGDFFTFDWNELLNNSSGSILVIGNFPWVTNSQQGIIGGTNLPEKNNFQNHSGFDAMTGKSNFDISEWMLIETAKWFQDRKGYLAMLCKTSVARKFLNRMHSTDSNVLRSAIYGIDAKFYFGASVDACLLFCEFDTQSHNYDYCVYENIDSVKGYKVGHRNGVTVRDVEVFEKLNKYYGQSKTKWRSGIKHDCSKIMEFKKIGEVYTNGLDEIVEIESGYLYPLLKGSDVANNNVDKTRRYVLVTQKFVGEETNSIKELAPKTWDYLERREKYFDDRKSKIYQNNPRFAIFGVGSYTFAPYKIAICGLYKKLEFSLVGQIENKAVMFDDTVYFLSFKTEEEAKKIFDILTSPLVKDFYSTLIFWDEKRPIKSSILNSFNLEMVAL